MIVKILGVFDLISAAIFWLYFFFHIGSSIIIFPAIYLIIKGALFLISLDIPSVIDIIVGILILISLNFSLPIFIGVLIILYLLQKGVLSLL